MFNHGSLLPLGVITLGLLLSGSAILAQTAGTQVQAPTVQAANTAAATRAAGIAAQYGSSVGSPEEAGTLIDGMRTGKDVTVGDVTVSGSGKTMGWGNVDIAMAMARSQIAADATSKDFLSALDQVMDMRSSGKGWGEIANDLGVNLGQVMGAAKTGQSKQATVATASSRSVAAKAAGHSADKGQNRGIGGQTSGHGAAGNSGNGNSGNGGGNGNSGGGSNGGGGNGGGGGKGG